VRAVAWRRMIQGRCSPGLTSEATPLVVVGEGALTQHFDGDRPLELRIVGSIYDAHAANANLRLDTIVPEAMANHGFSLGGWRHSRTQPEASQCAGQVYVPSPGSTVLN
jgi:hypothetical protein